MHFTLLAALLSWQPDVVGPPAPPPIVDRRRECPEQANDEEIVVCGEQEEEEDSPYRIPREFRDLPSNDDANASWDARFRDEEALGRFGDPMTGLNAGTADWRRMECQWRAARQEAQGRRPDCGARGRPDSPTDYQRQQRR